MELEKEPNFNENNIIQYNHSILNILLLDRTTNKNIIWATNDYADLGNSFLADSQIYPYFITGYYSTIVQPRITKEHEKKNNRTRDKAEVFTPSWICNTQNNLIDEQWFGHPNVFNTPTGNDWIATKGKILFPDDNKVRDWKHYVDANRLEITCGEAPYLVSRYDTVTGKPIGLLSRIGLLDRKLRIVTENTESEEEWITWAFRAYESIYGYEFQGDNLLLARENLINTFIDNIKYALNRGPTFNELKRVATIISWNLWQMDGLTFGPPLYKSKDDEQQLEWISSPDDIDDNIQPTMFDLLEEQEKLMISKPAELRCKIKDWRSKKILEYYSLVQEE